MTVSSDSSSSLQTGRASGSPINGELRERVQRLKISSTSAVSKGGLGNVTWLPWVLCGFLALTWAGVAIRGYRAAPKDEDLSGPTPVAKTATNSGASGGEEKLAVVAGSVQLEVKGYLIPAQQIAVSPIDVGGRLIELNFVEGQKYPKDYVLARIDASSYKATLDEAEKALTSALRRKDAALKRWDEQRPEAVRDIEKKQVQAELDEAKALELRAKQEIDRQDAIRNTVALSQREVQQAQADYAAAKARTVRLTATLDILEKGPRPERIAAAKADYDAAVADEQAAEARVRQARWRVDNCEIKAPIEATVLAKKSEKWNLVNPLAFGATSGSICDMADLRDLEVDLEIPERDIAKLKVGQPTRIRADAFPNRVYEGRLDRIMPIANRSKSIVNVRVKVKLPANEEPGTYLKPEMGAVVSFLPLQP